MDWELASEKFRMLTAPYVQEELKKNIVASLAGLERLKVTDLTKLLEL
jgi:hypothetical protein